MLLPEHLQRFNTDPIRVLSDGQVQLIGVFGDDNTIVDAARISFGQDASNFTEEGNRNLLRYLLRERHSTPYEMCEIMLRIRMPMDCHRQQIRHRTACLAEGTEVYFDLPGGVRRRGNQLHKLNIEDIWAKFQPTQNKSPKHQKNPYFKRDRVRGMRLRQVNEDTRAIQRTRVVDVFKNGVKPVFRVTLADGKTIESTADHQFLFVDGWDTLKGATNLEERNGLAVYDQGDYFLHVNGTAIELPAMYQDKAWLDDQYNTKNRKIAGIAEDCGVSYHTIRKWLRHHDIQHTKGGRSKEPWNKDKTYTLGPRELSDAWREANRRARAGAASNFWKGGASSDRASIARWTTQAAPRIHRKNGWTCQLCHQRASELHCHHVVPVWANESLARNEDNLTTLCGDCHRGIQGKEQDYVESLGGPPVKTEWVKRPRVPWNKLTVARLVRVEKIEFIGDKMTYDLEVEGPFHNFIANGIVTHNSVNEYSTRYKPAIDSMDRTDPAEWRTQSRDNKQGSAGVLTEWPEDFKVQTLMDGLPDEAGAGLEMLVELEAAHTIGPGEWLTAHEKKLHQYARWVYEKRLELGVAREQARKDLPLSTYTEYIWKMDLHNLFHYLGLRLDSHAQLEIRSYAQAIASIVKEWVPWAWEAFEDYRLNAMYLTRFEVDGLRSALQIIVGLTEDCDMADVAKLVSKHSGLPLPKKGKKPPREWSELQAKLARLLGTAEVA